MKKKIALKSLILFSYGKKLIARNVMRYLGIYLILIKIAIYEVMFTAKGPVHFHLMGIKES